MFYSVHKGQNKGIYNTWSECKEQIDGYSKPVFKKFDNQLDAQYFLENGYTDKKQEINVPKGYYIVYTDGSCKKLENNIKAGYGIYFGKNDSRNCSKRFNLENPTNNRAELLAILECLKIIEKEKNPYVIMTDSKYSIESVTKYALKWETNDWKTIDGENVKNRELIEPIYKILKDNSNIEMRHLNSHTGYGDKYSEGNKCADKLANDGCINK